MVHLTVVTGDNFTLPKINHNYKGSEFKRFTYKRPGTDVSARENKRDFLGSVLSLLDGRGSGPPAVFKGWMKKEGHVLTGWKRRFFVLMDGSLSYYEKELETAPFGASLKGVLALKGYSLLEDDPDPMSTKIHLIAQVS